jgi:non-heme chloroperoxidase
MNRSTRKDGAQIYFKDWGPKNAQPLVFHHGWPLSAESTTEGKAPVLAEPIP